ncbi:MAG TPA: GNAT family protein, partial [Iamia sp.]|nr:GNAT family protein [Iamia sp.]
TPSPAQFAEGVFAGVLTQVLAIKGDDVGQLVGWFQLYNVEPENGIGFIGAANFGDDGPAFGVAAALFLELVFDGWDLHKLYLEVPEINEPKVASAVGAFLQVEGRLLDRAFVRGRPMDIAIYALLRSTWRDFGARRFLGLDPPDPAPS